MTSPVDTSVIYTHSQMSGAPVLTDQAGSMIALLDAVLINGFDTKSANSINIAAGIATLTFTGNHSAEQETVIQIAGATGAYTDINDRQKIVSKSLGVLTFKTSLPDGSVPGTLSFMMAPAGSWTKPFTLLNIAVYHSTDPMSNGHYLRVDDTDNLSSRVRAYETMSDANTGTGMFPTDAQLNNLSSIPANTSGGYWYRGYLVNTSPIGWTFFADSRFFMICSQNYQSQGASFLSYSLGHLKGFGDPVATRPSGDTYSTMLSVGYTNSANGSQGGSFSQFDTSYGSIFTARQYTGLGGSEQQAMLNYCAVGSTNDPLSGSNGSQLGRFPSPIDGSLRFCQKYIRKYSITGELDYSPRANIPGILYIPMSGVFSALPPKTIINGSGAFANKKLVAVGVGTYGTDTSSSPDSSGIVLVDITGPWR